MTNNKTKPTTVPTPFFMGSNSLFCSWLFCPLLSPKVAKGNKKWGLQSVCNTSSVLFLPPHALSWLQSPSPPTGNSSLHPSSTWISLTSCSSSKSVSVWSSHGVTGPVRNLFPLGLSMGSQLPSGTPTSADTGPAQTTGGSLFHHGPLWAVGDNLHQWHSPEGPGESLLQHLEYLLPLLLLCLCCLWRYFSRVFPFISFSCCCTVFSAFTYKLSQRCHELAWFAQLCPVVGLFWSHLELSQSDMGATSDLFLEKSSLQATLLLKPYFVNKLKTHVLIKSNWNMHTLKYFTEPAEVKPMSFDPSPSIKTVCMLIWCYHSGIWTVFMLWSYAILQYLQFQEKKISVQ